MASATLLTAATPTVAETSPNAATSTMLASPEAPVAAAKCYAVPYGGVGVVNSILSLYLFACMTAGRTPLWPRRMIRRKKLSGWICGIAAGLVLSLNGVNYDGCLGKNAAQAPDPPTGRVAWALGFVIMGKLLMALFYMSVMAGLVGGIKVDETKANTNANDGASNPTFDHSDVNEIQPQSELAVLDDHQWLNHDSETQFDGVDTSPPSYESIVLARPDKGTVTGSTSQAPASQETSSRDAGTQTSAAPPETQVEASSSTQPPIPSHPPATENARATSADQAPVKTGPKPLPTHIDDTTLLVLMLLNLIVVVFVLAGAVLLSVESVQAKSDRAWVITLIFSSLLGTVLLGTLLSAGHQWRKDWNEAHAAKVASLEDGGALLANETNEAVSDDPPEYQTLQEAERSAPAADTAGKKNKLRLPFIFLPMGVVSAYFVMWYADWAVAAATGSISGVPTANVETGQWVTYLVASKLPLLCF